MCSGLFLPLLTSDPFLLLLRCSFLLVSSAPAWVAHGLQSLKGIPALMWVTPFQKCVSSHAPTTSPSTCLRQHLLHHFSCLSQLPLFLQLVGSPWAPLNGGGLAGDRVLTPALEPAGTGCDQPRADHGLPPWGTSQPPTAAPCRGCPLHPVQLS